MVKFDEGHPQASESRANRSVAHYVRAVRRRLRSRFICFGTLRDTQPVNPAFGLGRGTPVDRYYIEAFLAANGANITGRVLEVGDREYTTRYGSAVTSSDVLHFQQGSPDASIVADLASCPQIADDSFDCIILTQTLHYVFDMFAAVREVYRILAPGGVVLCTVPGLSQISRWDMDRWGDRWRLTSLSSREMFELAFAAEDVAVTTFGNALSALCFIEGIPAERITRRELDVAHEDYQVLIAISARKPVSL